MKRRTAIRNLVIISAGTAFLPGCNNSGIAAIPLKNIEVSNKEQNMLAQLCETIIPKTKNFIGAKDLKSHQFLLIMIDDCSSPEEQKIFVSGLQVFDKLSHDKFGQIFTACTADQKKSLLTAIENKKDVPADALQFYATVKRYTLQSFTTCKEYMVDIKKYKMIPGPNFKGCVQVKNV